MYGVYDTGPWLGIKMRGNDFVGWIGGGTRTFDLMVGEYDTSPASSCSGLETHLPVSPQNDRQVQTRGKWDQDRGEGE